VRPLRSKWMRRPVLGVSASLLLLAFAVPATAGAVDRRLLGDFNAPIQVAAPSWVPGTTIYVAEKGGRIIRRVAGGNRNVVLDIRGSVSTGGEQGLLSITFGPHHYMFVYYTNRAGDSRVIRYTLGRRGAHVFGGSRKVLLRQGQPFTNHNGGTLDFRDGHLYLSLGDGGSGCDPGERAQNLGTRLGKLLRKDSNGWRIIAYGLRNPWRWSFDRMTGALYIGDVGQTQREEIDFLRARKVGLPRENFGWDRYEGSLQGTCPDNAFNNSGDRIMPRFEYGHSGGGLTGSTVIGGFVYRGSNMPSQRGRYFFGDLDGWVRTADARTLNNRRNPGFSVPTLVSFGENSPGELFAVSLNGPVYKLVPG
jgi:glucose/arabinose dehydrogenase